MRKLPVFLIGLGLLLVLFSIVVWAAGLGLYERTPMARSPVYELAFTMSQHKNGPSGEALFEALYLARGDGSGLRRLQPNGRGASVDEFIWSPGGRRIAFTRKAPKSIDVYVMNADGSRARRVTRLGNRNMAESWSPNGEELLIRNYGKFPGCYCDCDSCFLPNRFFIARLAGEKPRRIFPTRGSGWEIGWTSEGALLMALQKGRSRAVSIYALRRDRSVRRLTPAGFDADRATVSKDGRIFTLIGDKGTWLMNSDGKILRRLPGVRGFISPDGRFLAYECKGVCVVRRGERRARELLEFPPEYPARSSCLGDPVWSPDSRSIAVEIGPCVNNSSRIMVVNVNGTGSHYLGQVQSSPDGLQYQSHPTWSPDSRSIAFSWHPLQPPSAFYVAQVDGQRAPVRLAGTRKGYVGLIAWRPVPSDN